MLRHLQPVLWVFGQPHAVNGLCTLWLFVVVFFDFELNSLDLKEGSHPRSVRVSSFSGVSAIRDVQRRLFHRRSFLIDIFIGVIDGFLIQIKSAVKTGAQ